jgi:ABC-type polysaccharide/polyol phosphate transport system ATPase subunit
MTIGFGLIEPREIAPAIRLQEVGLCYRLAKHRASSFKEYAIHFVRGALQYQELWALRDVSVEVAPGTTIGVMGSNGAGKSTLLKVISRVLKPSHGTVEVNGFVSPILELGTGFDHELTGYENIFLNALLLGRKRKQVQQRIESIIEFSGLGDMIHAPIRNYSSGMVARLGFSIATAWPAEVLLLDEVLAVGDANFVRRCRSKIEEFRTAGSTVVLVSHDLESLRSMCTRALWLDRGQVKADGPIEQVLAMYQGGLS